MSLIHLELQLATQAFISHMKEVLAMQNDTAAVRRATAAINEVLAQLEKDTSQLVRGVSLERIEVTNMSDAVPRYQCTVHIELDRLPSHGWTV